MRVASPELQRVMDELAKAGFKMSVHACGCCSSPWVKVELNGETLVEQDMADFDMFEETKP